MCVRSRGRVSLGMKLFLYNSFSGLSPRRVTLMAIVLCLMNGAVARAEDAAEAKTAIVPNKDGGRTVWVNNESYVAPGTAAVMTSAQPALNTTKLIYWSRTEHRWKRVP